MTTRKDQMSIRPPADTTKAPVRMNLFACTLLSAAALLCIAASGASATGTAEHLAEMPVTESFDGGSESLQRFASDWSTLGWASGSSAKGSDTAEGWRPVNAFSTLNGAYYDSSFADQGPGLAASATMAVSPGLEGRYFSLWLDMPTPGGTKVGYELRFTDASITSSTYTVKLSKWAGGAETVLASKSSYSFQVGASLALVDSGGAVSAWTDTGSGFEQLLSAADSTFEAGNAGVAGAGNYTRLTDFKAGPLVATPPDTTITSGSSGNVTPDVSFAFSSSEEGSSFECALDAGSYSACTSPKSYEGLAEGSHTFKARAVGAGGPDDSPAERSVTVVGTGNAVSGVSVLDDFGREEDPIANGKWTKTSWAQSIGASWTGSWHGFGGWGGTLAGAYWTSTSYSDENDGLLVSATLGSGPTANGEYVSLWLDMPSPGSARSGYEARFTGTNGSSSAYKVELSKWASGTRTVLATKEGFSLPVNTTFALTETGGRLGIWTGTSGFSRVLTAYDATYDSGYAGIETYGGEGTAYNFRAGNVANAPPDTTITSGSSGNVTPDVSFAFSSSEEGSSFECALDAGSYSACTSPKSYEGLAEGSHTFKARAVGAGGPDDSPAERSVTVVGTGNAVSGVSVLDDFGREEDPIANGKWTKTSWAQSIGASWTGSWHGFGGWGGTLAGAYWTSTSYSDENDGLLVSATLGSGPTANGEYVSLWLDMPSPGSARSGYEARFTGTNGSSSAYKVELSKWASGTRTVLATKEGFSLPVNTTFALTETGGRLGIWTGTSGFSRVLTAYDATYDSGYAGIETYGGEGTAYNFRAGNVTVTLPDTTIESGPTGTVLPSEVSFLFASNEPEAGFECSLDSESYSSCASPKSYPEIVRGEHTFDVRAVDAAGNRDATPATRTFQVVQPPTVVTEAPTEVKAEEATLVGLVNPKGETTTYQFEYGTSTSYGSVVPTTPEGVGAGSEALSVGQTISGLGAGTTYHFRIVATNSSGTAQGDDQTFTTSGAPTAATEAATEVKAEEATLNARVNPERASTSYQFEYGTSVSYGSTAPASPAVLGSGNEAVEVSEALSSLAENTTYHYRVVAENEVGVTYGEDETFETPSLPEATTEAAVSVEANEAVVAGTVDPNGSETSYQFEYAAAAEYEESGQYNTETTPSAVEAGDGEEEAETWEALGELEPETTYHYRMVAESPTGTAYGPDHTLTTTSAVMTPEEEEEENAAERAVTSTYNGNDLPANFFGMMWTGNEQQMTETQIENAVWKSGAKMLRLKMSPYGNQGLYETTIEKAARRGITVVPYIGDGPWPTDTGGQSDYINYVETVATKYRDGGSFWSGKSFAKPMHAIELWNEPNLGRWYPDNGVNKDDIEAFGEFFSKMAAKAHNNNIDNVILAGLFGFTSNVTNEPYHNKSVMEFLQLMGHTDAYDSVGVHPYVFKVGNNLHKPQTEADVIKAKNRIRTIISDTRKKLDSMGQAQSEKQLWVTEAGFPVEYGSNDPPGVTEQVQKELVESTLYMMQNKHTDFKIGRVFYYNLQDRDGNAEWESHTGLRRLAGGDRPAWRGYAKHSGGDQNWPANPNKTGESVKKRPNTASFSLAYDTYGQRARVKVKLGRGSSGPYEQSKEASFGATREEDIDAETASVSSELSGLSANETYHYEIETTGEDEMTQLTTGSFKTPEKDEVGISVKQALNGEPGWVTVGGYVHEGAGDGEVGPPIPNVWLNVNFWKLENGSWVYKSTVEPHPVTSAEGYYEVANREVGKGTWKVRAVLPAQSGWPETETEFHEFTIKNGYQLVAKHSGKCLDVSGASTANTALLQQWDCYNPETQANQVFTLRPFGNATYELVARNSGKCADVRDASQEQGALIQQYDCLGAGQTNQIWQGVPVVTEGGTEWVNFRAQHSGKCLDVSEGSTANGALLHQWSCLGAGQANQLWRVKSVEAGPIPTETFLSTDHLLHGNGQQNGNWGRISVSGHLFAAGRSMENRVVQVEFDKLVNGSYQRTNNLALTVNSAGEYRYDDYTLAPGIWRVRGEFMGNSELNESASSWHDFSIFQANRIVNRHANKCLSLSGNEALNGQHMILWDCAGTGSLQDGQTFWFWPLGNHVYEITVISSGKCLDVADGYTGDGGVLQEWACNGNPQQRFELLPIEGQEPWYALRPQQAPSKCIDDLGGNANNGAGIGQWSCDWNGNQQWEVLGVVGG